MKPKLYISDKTGEYFHWWIKLCGMAGAHLLPHAEYFKNRDELLKQHNAVFVDNFNIEHWDNESFIQFQSEENVSIFLLKFS